MVSGVLRRWAVPGALAALALLDAAVAGRAPFPDPLALSLGLVVAAALALGWRQLRPAISAVTASALVTGYLVLLQSRLEVQPALEPFLIMLVAFFSLGLHADERTFAPGLAATALPLVAVELAALAAGRAVGDVLPSFVLWGAALVLGRMLHRQRRDAEEARHRAAEAGREAAEAAALERDRIARELHDVVAHSLSVIVVHAGVERRQLPDRSGSTWQTLDLIERTGREALADLRHVLGLLRASAHHDALEPPPSLDRVEALATPLREAGHQVSVEVVGTSSALSPGLGASAFRIVQEALTNVVKHAPGAPVRIRVCHGPDGLSVEVANGPGAVDRPAAGALPPGGHGLVGMRERVKVYGGRLSAAPGPDGGFVVRALLPTEPT